MRNLTLVGVGAVLLLLSAPWAFARSAATIERGVELFTDQKCHLCHSIDGDGNKKGALDGVGSKLTADEIKAWIVSPKEMTEKTGATRKPPMKAFPKLSAEDVSSLVEYLASLKTTE